MTYSCEVRTIKYATTRRGVNATAKILRGGKPIATLYDVAEDIVAQVEFTTHAEHDAFLAKAVKLDWPEYVRKSDSFLVSEYARKIVADAESEYEQQRKK